MHLIRFMLNFGKCDGVSVTDFTVWLNKNKFFNQIFALQFSFLRASEDKKKMLGRSETGKIVFNHTNFYKSGMYAWLVCSKPWHQSRLLSAIIIEPKIRFSDHSHPNGFIKFIVLLAIFMSGTVSASHSSDDAIILTFEGQRSVIVVRRVNWTAFA